MCGRRAGEEPYIPPKAGNTFSAKLGGADYTFRQAVLKRPQPNYYDRQVSTRILGRRTAPFPPYLIPNRVPHCFTQEPSTDLNSSPSQMKAECGKFGMKPVCDHPSYCANNVNSLYLGQSNHISYPPHRNIASWFPSGWSGVKDRFAKLCFYTYTNRGTTMCNINSASL